MKYQWSNEVAIKHANATAATEVRDNKEKLPGKAAINTQRPSELTCKEAKTMSAEEAHRANGQSLKEAVEKYKRAKEFPVEQANTSF